MCLELDHLFLFTTVGAPEVDRLLDLGFLEGSSNTHPGQGTANRRIFFRNAMLEFLWICDEAEARSPAIERTRLWERSHFWETGYSPIGICLRWRSPKDAATQSPPFKTWDFRPPYLPPTLKIDVASQTTPAEPLIFMTPFGKRPDTFTGDRIQPLNHPNNCQEMTRLKLSLPDNSTLSDAAQTLKTVTEIEIIRGTEFRVEVECDRGIHNKTTPPASIDLFHNGLAIVRTSSDLQK